MQVKTAAVSAATAAALLVGGTVATPADAASKVKFLSKGQIPTEKKRFSSWNESKVITGMKHQEGCSESALPKKTVQFRFLYNDDEGNLISQYVAKMPSEAKAKKLVKSLTYCGSKEHFDKSPKDEEGLGKVTFRTYGNFDLEDGLLVRTSSNRGGSFPASIGLTSIGRDGKYVMFMEWPFQTTGKAPKDMWIKVSKKGLSQLR